MILRTKVCAAFLRQQAISVANKDVELQMSGTGKVQSRQKVVKCVLRPRACLDPQLAKGLAPNWWEQTIGYVWNIKCKNKG